MTWFIWDDKKGKIGSLNPYGIEMLILVNKNNYSNFSPSFHPSYCNHSNTDHRSIIDYCKCNLIQSDALCVVMIQSWIQLSDTYYLYNICMYMKYTYYIYKYCILHTYFSAKKHFNK